MLKKIVIFCLINILFFLLVSCEYFKLKTYKDWEDLNNERGKIIIYTAGYYLESGNYYACYWKDDGDNLEKITLPGNTNAAARSIFIHNNNIYIAGVYNDSGANRACYWINEELKPLNVPSGVTSSSAMSIFKINKDVLVTGFYVIAGDTYACYWKNGERYLLDNPGIDYYTAISIYAKKYGLSSYDFYISGYYDNGSNNVACSWENGNLMQVESDESEGRSIFVSEIGDVYMTGFKWITGGNTAFFWKNKDNSVQINNIETEANSIFISKKGDIYTCGFDSSGITTAYYWKNTSDAYPLSGTNSYSIYVFSDDVYVSGYYDPQAAPRACYWKNGKRINLDDGLDSMAYSIFVKKEKIN